MPACLPDAFNQSSVAYNYSLNSFTEMFKSKAEEAVHIWIGDGG